MAASCPSCGRPVALARPQCLYCGAGLPASVLEEAARQAEATLAAPAAGEAAAAGPPRSLIVLDLEAADAEAVGAALGLSGFEASQRIRRGGWQLHRIVPEEDAAREAAQLARAGLRVLALPEAEVRAAARPLRVAGGFWASDGLTLRTEAGPASASAEGLLLVVRGPIAREYLTPARARRVRTATLDPGYRFHLHRKDEPRPLELDPAAFDFGLPSVSEPSLLLLSSWVEKLAKGVPVDDRFRREHPALAPASAEAGGIGAVLGAAPRRKEDEAQVLDNVEQFRFYSAWRACASRRAR
jgi:hypothetical protein